MKRFYKYSLLLMLLPPLAGSQAIATEQQQAQGPADGLTAQQREQHTQQARQQQEKMQADHAKMLRELNAQRLQEEIKK